MKRVEVRVETHQYSTVNDVNFADKICYLREGAKKDKASGETVRMLILFFAP